MDLECRGLGHLFEGNAARLLAGRLGFPLGDDKITKITTVKVTMDMDPAVWPQADGEPPPRAGVRHAEFKILPDRIRLWVPDGKQENV